MPVFRYRSANNVCRLDVTTDQQLFFQVEYTGWRALSFSRKGIVLSLPVRSLIRTHKKQRLLIDDVFLLLLQGNKADLKKLAAQACLSSKQLERKFKERTGVNPKLFERIIRFDKAFRLRNAQPGFDWLRIAVECNYHDYQHLAKEYKDFTGLHLLPFTKLKTMHRNGSLV